MARKPRNYNELSDKPLTPREIQRAREIMQDIDRMRWLGRLFLKIVGIIAATAGLAATLKDWWIPIKG